MNIKYFLTLLFFLLTVISTSENIVQAQNSTYGITFNYNENEISYKISNLDFAKSPSWKPEQGEPPVAMQSALEIARANLPRFVKNADDFRVKHINLGSLCEDKWFYEISFNCQTSECTKNSGLYFRIMVKMDSQIIEPKITQLKEKEKKSLR